MFHPFQFETLWKLKKTNTLQTDFVCMLIMKLSYIGFVLLIQLQLSKHQDIDEDTKLYHNHFAVEIQGGESDKAEEVAQRHGFINLGQILQNYYLFEHPHVHKR